MGRFELINWTINRYLVVIVSKESTRRKPFYCPTKHTTITIGVIAMRYICYQAPGSSHIAQGAPCQDKTAFVMAKGSHVISLADGAGSASLSHVGAESITAKINDYLAENFDTIYSDNDGIHAKQEIIEYIQKELNSLSRSHDCKIKDLASTLLAVAMKKNRFILLHIGDGVTGCIKNNKLIVATHPENGEFCNQTYFTTSPDVISTMQIIKGTTKNIAGFILMSDGTETSLYSKKDKTMAPAAMKLMYMCAMMDRDAFEDKLNTLMIEMFSKKTSDDCSLAILVDEVKIEGIIFNNNSPDTKERSTGVRYEAEILSALEGCCTIKQLSKQLHINSKAIYRKINNLKRRGYVSVYDGNYIVMKKNNT